MMNGKQHSVVRIVFFFWDIVFGVFCAFCSFSNPLPRSVPFSRIIKPGPIIPSWCIVGVVSWEIEAIVKEVQQTQPDPGDSPTDFLFVPDSACLTLQLGHSSNLTHHPNYHQPSSFSSSIIWWPSMGKDTREFVDACFVSTRGKPSYCPPAVFLCLLPIPLIPLYGHIVLDILIFRICKKWGLDFSNVVF